MAEPLSALLNSLATFTGGPPPPGLCQPWATAAIRRACLGVVLGMCEAFLNGGYCCRRLISLWFALSRALMSRPWLRAAIAAVRPGFSMAAVDGRIPPMVSPVEMFDPRNGPFRRVCAAIGR